MNKLITDCQPGVIAMTRFSKEYEATPTFFRIGNNTAQGRVEGKEGWYEEMADMSAAAHWMFWTLSALRDPETNRVVFKAKDNLMAKKVSKGYKELLKAGILVRIKRQHYLFNPQIWFPGVGQFQKVSEQWDQLMRRQSNDQ